MVPMQSETHELPKDWLSLSDIKETLSTVKRYDTLSLIDEKML